MRHLTHQTNARYRSRDNTAASTFGFGLATFAENVDVASSNLPTISPDLSLSYTLADTTLLVGHYGSADYDQFGHSSNVQGFAFSVDRLSVVSVGTVVAVPERSTWLLIIIGLFGLWLLRSNNRKLPLMAPINVPS
jgi:hypothetical protein